MTEILGAKGHTAIVLQDYIAGYSFGIIGQALYPLLLWFLNFNGNEKISQTSIALMCVLNLCFDMLMAVWSDMSAFGSGLATSLSYLITCAYVFREFFVNYGWRQTTFSNIHWGELVECAKICLWLCYRRRQFPLSAPTLERAFSLAEDFLNISDEVVDFCKSNNFNPKVSTFAGVVTEELLSNVIIYGTKSTELSNSYIRVTLKDDLNIRIYDDNRAFNPRKEMKKINSKPERPGEEKIGLRLVKSITDRFGAFDYQNTAGIHTSIIKLRHID